MLRSGDEIEKSEDATRFYPTLTPYNEHSAKSTRESQVICPIIVFHDLKSTLKQRY